MKIAKSILLFLLTTQLHAQQHSITGQVRDEKASPIMYATIALLNPADSTLAYYCISNSAGHFEIKNIAAAGYILQTAFIGYKSFHKNIEVPIANGGDVGSIVLNPVTFNLSEAEIAAERIPILLKKDTIEYDAAAYKTNPDAAAEDLLKKLPGVEVDRAGNIRALGEDVKNVLVDGKEFFGSDPKVATKNLPADAIKKVQVYDKKSDETELTGIEDGTRNKTINLLLKDDKKSAWLGDVLAGVGNASRYQASAKTYHFTEQSQFAFLGMLNNINQFGFSFRDYIDFNGGFRSMMDGGGGFRISANDDNALPINFGQPINGLITSGAGGANYTYERKKDSRFNISYLGNGTDKKLNESTTTQNYLAEKTFIQNENFDQVNKNRAHRMNFLFRGKPDSTTSFIINGGASLTSGIKRDYLLSESSSQGILMNQLNSKTINDANGLSTNARASYLKKGSGRWKLLKFSGDFYNFQSLTKSEWYNWTRYVSTSDLFNDNQFQDNNKDLVKYSAGVSLTHKTGSQYYLEPVMQAGFTKETLARVQGPAFDERIPVDSLSPDLINQYQWFRPGIVFKRSNERSQFSAGALMEGGELSNSYNDFVKIKQSVIYFVPRLSWDLEYRKSRRIGIDFETQVNIPDANQLFPAINTINPIELISGNQELSPEFIHSFQAHWMLFDQFSFTSVFAGLRGIYVKDKINVSSLVDDKNFSQSVTLINVKNHYQGEANIEFSTPVRKLGITLHVNASEKWNRGISLVNGIENINTNLRHELTVSADNRKKERWSINAGGTIQFTSAAYSLQEALNDKFFNTIFFTEINFEPNSHWNLSLSAEVTKYQAKSFTESIQVPLLKASISHYFLKAKRGALTLEAFDLLNMNSGVQRYSEFNYLRQKESNVIGRYFMITFKYRLNKFDGGDKIDVKVN